MSSLTENMLVSEESICEALRLHSDSLNVSRLDNPNLDSDSKEQRNRMFRRRSSSLCLASACVVLEPCLELSQDDCTTTTSSNSTGEPDMPKEGPFAFASDRFKVLIHLTRTHIAPIALLIGECPPRPSRSCPSAATPSRRPPSPWSTSAAPRSTSSSARYPAPVRASIESVMYASVHSFAAHAAS